MSTNPPPPKLDAIVSDLLKRCPDLWKMYAAEVYAYLIWPRRPCLRGSSRSGKTLPPRKP